MLTLFIYDILYASKNIFPFERVIKLPKNEWNYENRNKLVSAKIGQEVLDFQYQILD
jgi:hypothetical protein